MIYKTVVWLLDGGWCCVDGGTVWTPPVWTWFWTMCCNNDVVGLCCSEVMTRLWWAHNMMQTMWLKVFGGEQWVSPYPPPPHLWHSLHLCFWLVLLRDGCERRALESIGKSSVIITREAKRANVSWQGPNPTDPFKASVMSYLFPQTALLLLRGCCSTDD